MIQPFRFVAAVLCTLTVAGPARAATVAFLLAPSANGNGNFVPGEYAVWAWTSLGDNAGLAAFTITTTGQTTTNNRSPRAVFSDPDFELEDKTSGFTLLRANGRSGVATTGAFDTVGGNGVYRFGIGQTAGNLNTGVPAGYESLTPATQASYGQVWYSVGGPLTPPPGSIHYTGGAIPVLLATGTGPSSLLTISAGLANVFTNASNGTTMAANIVLLTGGFTTIPEPSALALTGVTGLLARRRIRQGTTRKTTHE